ncbi:hypothetical protein CY35_19G093900 [Sphagnum magellanicum]|nr:hypothetical protein CY35_19G093900 [Sphagnum magellanicum]
MSPSLSSSASLCTAAATMQEHKSIKLWNELSSACNPAMPSSTELEATPKFTPPQDGVLPAAKLQMIDVARVVSCLLVHHGFGQPICHMSQN